MMRGIFHYFGSSLNGKKLLLESSVSSSLEPFIFHHLDHHCFALPQLTGSIWLYHLQSGQASFGGSLKATVVSFLLDSG